VCFYLYCRYKLDPRRDLTQQKVIAIPDISIYDRNKSNTESNGCPEDDVMILACDGVFDVMDNVTVVKNIREIIENMEVMSEKADVVAGTKGTPVRYSDVARILISSCLALQSTDNISVCIVPLNPCK
jgi:serine/threonine protein phosphatase PrpC